LRHSVTETIENFFYYQSQTFSHHVLTIEGMLESDSFQPNKIYQVNIQLDEKRIFYYRTYSNIFNVLGDIGGLYRALIFLAMIVIVPFTKLQQNIALVNSIFSFELSEEKKIK